MQQGIQIAINSVVNIAKAAARVISLVTVIKRYDDDAQVLIKTCPAWGSLVLGRKKASRIPSKAAGLIRYHSSMNPR